MMKKKGSLDYYLILVTVAVLFVISIICIYGMFYFKIAQVQDMAPVLKAAYMDQMNRVMSPFLIILLMLLGICVPKRLLPARWLGWFTSALAAGSLLVTWFWGLRMALVMVLCLSLVLQVVVLFMAIAGSSRLNFTGKTYWVRVGSSLLHLGIILFVLDLFFHQQQTLHLVLFWVTTVATVLGMLFSFYADGFASMLRRRPD